MTVATEFSDEPVAVGSSELYIEFRCGSCYQVRHELTKFCGDTVGCPYCQKTNDVPDMDEMSLRTAEQVAAVSGSVTVQQGQFAEADYTAEEIAEIARVRAENNTKSVAYGEAAIGEHSDMLTRGIARLIDGCLLALSMAASFAVGTLASKVGLCPSLDELEPIVRHGDFVPPTFIICFSAVYALVTVVFWWMTSALGQTPGKMLMGIKIVTGAGGPPGFLRGVVARSWIAGLVLGIVPLGPLIDIGMAFISSPPRCVHDHIAGTYVVQS